MLFNNQKLTIYDSAQPLTKEISHQPKKILVNSFLEANQQYKDWPTFVESIVTKMQAKITKYT